MRKDKERRARPNATREYVEAIIFALILALIIKTFFIQAFKIPSGSMIPTLLKGDQILVNKFIYGTRIPLSDVKVLEVREPRRGDIVVFEYPEDRGVHYIKRLIGLPGDTIEVVNKAVFVNGEVFDVAGAQYEDNEILPSAISVRDNFGPLVIPPHSYFMMGDNRDNSRDSRFWGFVDNAELVGNAVIIYWSWDISSGGLAERAKNIRWGRLGMLLFNK
ncbi:MAG: signal peptidase I [Deltaproteobacteria bacterium]|nr:signal peptidase I [Candidatus Zymogenaceae bacterium]